MGGSKKRQLKFSLRRLSTVKTWQLALILLILLFIEATFLRIDHIRMTDLKTAVTNADAGIIKNENGEEYTTTDQEEIDAALNRTLGALRDFVSTHTVINVVEKNGESHVTFGTGPIYLEQSYIRKATAAIAEAEANAATDENPNGNVFAKAMDVCKPQAIASGWAWNSPEYLNCMTGEIAKYPTTDTLEDTYAASLPSTALFRYDFASPIWTFTPSGILGIVCIVLTAIVLLRAFLWLVLHIALIFVKH